MGRKSIKDLTATVLQMENGLIGMRMDKSGLKVLIRIIKEMGNGHFITMMVQYTKSKNTNFKYPNCILKSKLYIRGVFCMWR